MYFGVASFERSVVSRMEVVCDCHTCNTCEQREILLEELGVFSKELLEHFSSGLRAWVGHLMMMMMMVMKMIMMMMMILMMMIPPRLGRSPDDDDDDDDGDDDDDDDDDIDDDDAAALG